MGKGKQRHETKRAIRLTWGNRIVDTQDFFPFLKNN